jgi:hypothetical protein
VTFYIFKEEENMFKFEGRQPRTLIVVTDTEWGISINERRYVVDKNAWETAHVTFDAKYKDVRRISDSITLVITEKK